MKVALIDADSAVYMIGWNYRDAGTKEEVEAACDIFLRDLLTLTNCDHYVGVFSPAREATFRNEVYKYAQYKGSRPEKPEFMVKWEAIIKTYFTMKHGFFTDPDLEADDVVAALAHLYYKNAVDYIICSPDKDLRQIAGTYYDFRKEGFELQTVTSTEAFWTFWKQMLEGDSSDNVAGVPGLGPVKADKLIKEWINESREIEVKSLVKAQYCKYFGGYYGVIIFNETELTLRLMCHLHPLYYQYEKLLIGYATVYRHKRVLDNKGFFDITS